MFSDLLLFAGLIALSLGLRSFHHPVIFRLGHLGLIGTTYLFGYRTSERHSIGMLLASLWVLFAEAEEEGFTQTEDLGWRGDDHRQFMRILTHAQKRIQATIHYVESEEAEFFYVTVSSRTEKGDVWNTWNYPFLLSLKPAPTWHFQRVSGDLGLLQILDSHENWLTKKGVTSKAEIPSEPEAVHVLVEQDAAALVSHNLKCGVLAHGDEGMVRYTLRGCWFLWTQFIRDLIGSR